MACLTYDGTHIGIGADFVEATKAARSTNGLVSLGEISVRKHGNTINRKWTSRLPISETEHYLREAAKNDGYDVVLFVSQAV